MIHRPPKIGDIVFISGEGEGDNSCLYIVDLANDKLFSATRLSDGKQSGWKSNSQCIHASRPKQRIRDLRYIYRQALIRLEGI